MAQLTVQRASQSGLSPAYAAAEVGGDQFANDGRTVLHVKNGGAGSIDVTVNSIAACSQGFDHNVTVSVPNGQERIIGPFPTDRFNDGTGNALITYTGVTTVTVAALGY